MTERTHDDDISFFNDDDSIGNESGVSIDPLITSSSPGLTPAAPPQASRERPEQTTHRFTRTGSGGSAESGNFINIATLRSQYGKRVQNTGSPPPPYTTAAAAASNHTHLGVSNRTSVPNDSIAIGERKEAKCEGLQKKGRSISIELTAEELYGDGAGLGGDKQGASADLGPRSSRTQLQTQSSSRRRAIQTSGHLRNISLASKTSKRSSDGTQEAYSLDKESAFEHLANFSDHAAASMEAASNIIKNGNMCNKKINVDANVLVALTLMDNVAMHEDISMELKQSTSAPVNKLGFPEGEGKTEAEERGPWVYVLAIVKTVHFREDEKYYTVERFDTGACQRADRGWMEWIEPGSEGELAALAAAKRTPETHDIDEARRGKLDFLKNSCFSRTARIFGRAACATKEFLTRQAELFTHGGPPYRIEIRFTTVNFLVICSIVVAFLDQFKFAFLTTKTDQAVMLIIL